MLIPLSTRWFEQRQARALAEYEYKCAERPCRFLACAYTVHCMGIGRVHDGHLWPTVEQARAEAQSTARAMDYGNLSAEIPRECGIRWAVKIYQPTEDEAIRLLANFTDPDAALNWLTVKEADYQMRIQGGDCRW